MKLSILTPTKAAILDSTQDEFNLLVKQLTYTNTGVAHLIKRHHLNYFWKTRNPEGWQYHLEQLKKDLKKCLVFNENGQNYIRPGSIPYLQDIDLEVENHIKYAEPKKMAWKNPPKFDLYPYQEESWTKLLAEKHGNVSLTTGSGKSLIITKLCRELGLRTCVVVPSRSIFGEMLEKFEHYFGKGNVGTFGAGKKKFSDKTKIMMCIGDSLANIEQGSEEHRFFNSFEALAVDESHEFAAESLEAVCHGVLSEIPYRFFFSATQLRNDGSLALLQSIIGKTVCTLTTAEAVTQGYICPHEFRIVSIASSNPSFESSEALTMKREHFLKNKNIANFAAKLANALGNQNKQTLVLVEELSQISMLVPLLTVPFAIAHSEKKKERLEELGIDKVDNDESIEKFNKNEVRVLVGTSAVSTGTNIFPMAATVNWVGGASPIRTKQGAVGRSVRFGHSNPWADRCAPKSNVIIYDFDIEDCAVMTRHLEARLSCYQESGTTIKYIRLKT